MRCKRCGGVFDAVSGECLKCGLRSIPKDHAPVIRSMEDLARDYLPADDEKTALPDLFKEYEGTKTKKAKVLDSSVDTERSSVVKGAPVYGIDEYARLLGVEDIHELSADEEGQTQEKRIAESRTSQPAAESSLHPVLRKIDRIIEKPADKILDIIHQKYPQPTRAKKSPTEERLTLLGGTLAGIVVLLVLAAVILSSIAPDITGEWLIAETAAGEQLTVEFTNSGSVTARAYIDGEENIYLTGRYQVRRSNGSNLLTITYDDGSEKRLYYVIDRDTGTFTNVESNKSDTYTRMK